METPAHAREHDTDAEMQAMAGPAWRDVAESAYKAFLACLDSDESWPEWDKLDAEEQTAWEAAVRHTGNILNSGTADSPYFGKEKDWKGWSPP